MSIIYKYDFGNANRNVLFDMELPRGAKFLKVAVRDETTYCWWQITERGPFFDGVDTKTRTFLIIGTGWSFPSKDCVFLETFFQKEFVWHLYEKVSRV